jgi:hypothetical protein
VALWFSGTLFCQWLVKHSNYDALAFMYAWAYNVQPNQVFESPKPHNCEWGAAPLGDKFCHYQKAVDAENDVKANRLWVGWAKVED